MSYTKEEARKIVLACQKRYRDKLANKKFLILFDNKTTASWDYIEIAFFERNYQHLTGIDLLDKEGRVINHCSNYFYKKCSANNLSNNEIAFKPDGTTQLKLEALPSLTDFTKITRITGDSFNNRPLLYVEKYVGGVNFCLGVSRDKRTNEYVPVSALREDIRDLVSDSFRVIAIFEKDYGEINPYKTIKYVAKGITLPHLQFPQSISEIIDLSWNSSEHQ